MVNSRIIRVNFELEEELRRIANLNRIKIIEASRIAASILKRSRDKKLNMFEEIKF